MSSSLCYTLFFGLTITLLTSACTKIGQAPSITPLPTSSGSTVSEVVTTYLTGTYIARGTEPFWAAEVSSTGIVFSRPGETGIDSTTYSTTQVSSGTSIIIKDMALNIEVILSPGTCSDGMSDTVYSYIATAQVGTGGLLTGCAN